MKFKAVKRILEYFLENQKIYNSSFIMDRMLFNQDFIYSTFITVKKKFKSISQILNGKIIRII